MGLKDTFNDLMKVWGYPSDSPPPPPPAPPPGPTAEELQWEKIFRKFRGIMGRDPYSFRELQDWWARF